MDKDKSYRDNWDRRYRETPLNDLGWEEGEPNVQLVTLIESGTVEMGPVLDLCCGSANNAIYLAQRGYDCHGIDISPSAIEYAHSKANRAQVSCQIEIGNAVALPYHNNMFTLIFDRGCFHSINPEDREIFVTGIRRVLKSKGKYLLICFSAKDHLNSGPPYAFSSDDIRGYFAQWLNIRCIKEFSSKEHSVQHNFLLALMEKLSKPTA